MKYNFITIEGNIGAGKTTLATKLSEDYDARLILERFEDNSFLPKFYKDPDKYAFPLEMSFLADRFQQLKDQLSEQDLFRPFTISDYFIDKSLIFARNNLKPDEFTLYKRLFHIISSMLPKPDLICFLYLDVPNLLNNIKYRGRDYEQEIKEKYLSEIQSGYLNHFKQLDQIRILIVETNHIDFVARQAHYEKIKEIINQDYQPGISPDNHQ